MLMDSAGSDRPQRITDLVGGELGRYKIEIAALTLALQKYERSKKLVLATHYFGVDVRVRRGMKQE